MDYAKNAQLLIVFEGQEAVGKVEENVAKQWDKETPLNINLTKNRMT